MYASSDVEFNEQGITRAYCPSLDSVFDGSDNESTNKRMVQPVLPVCSNVVCKHSPHFPLCRPTQHMLAPFLISCFHPLADLLHSSLPAAVHMTLFDDQIERRQAVINRCEPGDGISPHVDLLGRYADEIVGVSLGSSYSVIFARI
jgi:hypothetical protein